MAKITIIGGTGFIGSALISRYNKDFDIQNLDKKESSIHPTEIVDVRNLDTLNKIAADTECVILLAAEHRDDVTPTSLYYDVNVDGTENVLKAMDEKGIKKIIFTSSVAVYGLNKVNPDENSPCDPFNHYGKSKWQAEEVLRKWHAQSPETKTLIIIRPTVVFGEENRGNVYNLLKQIKTGRFMMVGQGSNKKSMAYIGNIISFIKYLLDNNVSGYNVFNYADKPDLSTLELVNVISEKIGHKKAHVKIPYWLGYLGGLGFDLLAKITGKKFPLSSVRIKKFHATTQFSADKTFSTGFKAQVSLKEGLERTIDSIK